MDGRNRAADGSTTRTYNIYPGEFVWIEQWPLLAPSSPAPLTIAVPSCRNPGRIDDASPCALLNGCTGSVCGREGGQ